MAKVPIQFTLNGSEKAEFVESGATLLNALRDKVGDTSPKGGCHQGTCGACATEVLAGTPEHFDAVLTPQEKREGKMMMICCSGALSDRLVLDL